MISLEGLTLLTGRHAEARDILQTFAHHMRDGLIPNLFPEGESEGLYHTADATLWFFHALERYERAAGEIETRRALLPKLVGIIEKHLGGTRYGIGVDPADGLLHQGAPGYQLTWMDAKVGDWVVTPRRGKAVEINALFYNALCLLERWLREEEAMIARREPESEPGEGGGARAALGLSAADVANLAVNTRRSFNERFWYAEGGYLYDVIDGEAAGEQEGPVAPDARLRPNQLLAISLPHPVLDRGRWESVLHTVREELLTPFGLRSLARRHPDYKANYDGDLRARDAAYHQGTVWTWLIGPFVDAWLKAFPGDRDGARGFLAALGDGLGRAGVGTLSEICDAEPPYQSRGCIAQAWSVAEALRVLHLVTEG
jgi:glycogen debranching enzyme